VGIASYSGWHRFVEAQTETIRGVVSEDSGEPAKNAVVALMRGGMQVAIASTRQGEFEFPSLRLD